HGLRSTKAALHLRTAIRARQPTHLSPPRQPGVSAKRKFGDPGLKKLVPYFYIDLGIDIGKSKPYIAHSDGLPQRRGLRAGGHFPDHRAREILDLIVMTGDSFFQHLETYQLSFDARGLLLFQDRPG